MQQAVESALVISAETKKPFRIVEIHKLHVTDAFLDELKEKFKFNYNPIRIKNLNCQAVITDTNTIVLQDLTTSEEIRSIPSTHKFGIRRLMVWESLETKKGQIISLSSDSLKARDLDGKGLRIFPGHNGKLTCMELIDEELYEDVRIVSGSSKGLIVVHMLKTAKVMFTLDRHTSPIVSLCLIVGIGEIQLIASMDKHQHLRLWDRESGDLVREFVA